MKSTIAEIRDRFDSDVERFSNLETGQAAAMDSPEHMDLLTEAAVGVTPHAKTVLDVGCGAGNYTLKLLERFQATGQELLGVTLLDLSQPMLDRAEQRVAAAGGLVQAALQSDIRDADLGQDRFDIIMAAQCLHHLREEQEWVDVFSKLFKALKPGGGLWIADSVSHQHAAIDRMMTCRWSDYLVELEDEAYRDKVFAYVDKEDSPRPLVWQLEKMRDTGFTDCEVLLKRNRFASFGGVKPIVSRPNLQAPGGV
jgi:tRNA (cmo5U34)-methyltransferase